MLIPSVPYSRPQVYSGDSAVACLRFPSATWRGYRRLGNRVVAKLGGVYVLDLSSIYRVASHTRVHRLPSGKIVGRQGETTGFILHKRNE